MAAKSEQMTELEIRKRLAHLRFTDNDAKLLESLRAWAEGGPIREFVHEFYEHQFRNPEFAEIIRSRGGTQEGLETAQAGYAMDLFHGFPNVAYAQKRQNIGELHARINITPQWYISSYQFYEDMFYPRVRSHLKLKRGMGKRAVSAINKLLVFDQAIITDTYIGGIMDQIKEVVVQVARTAGGVAESSGVLPKTSEQAGQALQGIATISQQVAQGSEQQSARSDEISTAMGQLSRAIEQVATGSQQQAVSIEQTASIVNQVSKAIDEVAQNAQAAAEGSGQATEAANNGRDLVSRTVEGMDRIKIAVETAATRIAELGQQSAEIGKIVNVIDDIAAQTNLLALNAAIEAARAGEQGRGFAVVADEVRKLAERVTDATKEIGNLIDGVQKGVAESVAATEEGTKEVESGSLLAQEAGEALEQISESVGLVTQQIEQISAAIEQVSASSAEMVKNIDEVSGVVEETSAATEQMSANSTQVMEAVDSIAAIIGQTSASTQEMSASTEELSAQVEEVVAASQTLDTLAQELREIVDSFNEDGAGAEKAEVRR